jgi:hypothetical protein
MKTAVTITAIVASWTNDAESVTASKERKDKRERKSIVFIPIPLASL